MLSNCINLANYQKPFHQIVYYDVGYCNIHRFYKSYYNVSLVGGKFLLTRRG